MPALPSRCRTHSEPRSWPAATLPTRCRQAAVILSMPPGQSIALSRSGCLSRNVERAAAAPGLVRAITYTRPQPGQGTSLSRIELALLEPGHAFGHIGRRQPLEQSQRGQLDCAHHDLPLEQTTLGSHGGAVVQSAMILGPLASGPDTVRPMTAAILFTLLGAVFVAVLVWSETGATSLRFVAKPLASVCFLVTALAAGAFDSGYGTWVFIALVLSAIGDVALLGSTSSSFLAGLLSFLLGHVAYVIAFGVRGLDATWTLVGAVALVAPYIVVLRWLLPHAGRMRGPVALYALVISAMVATAAGTMGWDADARILVAAVAFYVSDLAVARHQFVAPEPSNRLWGLPLYYGAQFLFAWTVVV